MIRVRQKSEEVPFVLKAKRELAQVQDWGCSSTHQPTDPHRYTHTHTLYPQNTAETKQLVVFLNGQAMDGEQTQLSSKLGLITIKMATQLQ